MTGWALRCPFCWRLLLPEDGLLHLVLAPRMAHHLWDAHPFETRILQLHIERPPADWPVLEAVAA